MSFDPANIPRSGTSSAGHRLEHDSLKPADAQVQALERIATVLSGLEDGQSKHLEKLETQNDLLRRIIHIMSGKD